LSAIWTALTEHFHLPLHEDRYNDDVFCARLRLWLTR
jgi:hypothetical protein